MRNLFILLLISINLTFAQKPDTRGFHIVFNVMRGHVLKESDIEYFDWTNKEIKLKKDTCIACLYKDDFTLYQLTTDIDLEIPHFSLFIDTTKVFDGYFPAMNFKFPVAPLIFIDRSKETALEIVDHGIIKFWPYRSVQEIEAEYDSLTVYYRDNDKPIKRIDRAGKNTSIKNYEIERLKILNDERLFKYLKSKSLLKE